MPGKKVSYETTRNNKILRGLSFVGGGGGGSVAAGALLVSVVCPAFPVAGALALFPAIIVGGVLGAFTTVIVFEETLSDEEKTAMYRSVYEDIRIGSASCSSRSETVRYCPCGNSLPCFRCDKIRYDNNLRSRYG
jgi:hypothetical protein